MGRDPSETCGRDGGGSPHNGRQDDGHADGGSSTRRERGVEKVWLPQGFAESIVRIIARTSRVRHVPFPSRLGHSACGPLLHPLGLECMLPGHVG
jgi:hypothetical protein